MTQTAVQDRLPRSEQRRRAIMDATLEVIAQGGTDSVTHRRVAAAAGVPLGSTTYYFSSREELIREAFRHYLAGASVVLQQLTREFPGRTAKGVVAYLIELLRRESATPNLVLAEYELILAAARDPELAEDLHTWERAQIANLAEVLESLGAERPHEAARSVFQLVRGFELESLTRPETDLEELRRRLAVVIDALTRTT